MTERDDDNEDLRSLRDEWELRRVTLDLCEGCIGGVGGECHTPGCILWMKTGPDVPLNRDLIRFNDWLGHMERAAERVGTDLCADCRHSRDVHFKGSATACEASVNGTISCRCMQFEEGAADSDAAGRSGVAVPASPHAHEECSGRGCVNCGNTGAAQDDRRCL